MSLQTWKEEFYPTPATDKCTTLEAAEHSLQKWIGIREKNLEKHDVFMDGLYVSEKDLNEEPLGINDKSCGLCLKMYALKSVSTCKTFCALADYIIANDSYRDERSTCREEYRALYYNTDPEPMIEQLEGTVQMILDKQKEL